MGLIHHGNDRHASGAGASGGCSCVDGWPLQNACRVVFLGGWSAGPLALFEGVLMPRYERILKRLSRAIDRALAARVDTGLDRWCLAWSRAYRRELARSAGR
jgi:hypothetical protein